MITVVCFLWFDPRSPRADVYTYDETHVQRLQHQVMMQGGGFENGWEFICVSDRKIDGVNTIPLDFTTFVSGTRFAKLMMFSSTGPLVGKRLLYLDLDTVVTSSLSPLVLGRHRSSDLVLWRNPNFGLPGRARYNTSIILHNAGTRPEFHTAFRRLESLEMVQKATGWGGTDQAWVSYLAAADEDHWTDADGVYGAGRLGDRDGVGAGTELPANARVVFFPGRRTPWTPGILEKHPWIAKYDTASAA